MEESAFDDTEETEALLESANGKMSYLASAVS